jgi:hypothetical protein
VLLIHLSSHCRWYKLEESERQNLMKLLCGFFPHQNSLLIMARGSEGVSKGVLNKFQEILGKPMGMTRSFFSIIISSGGCPPDIQRCLAQIASRWNVEKFTSRTFVC